MKNSNQEMHPLHDVIPEDAIGMLVADHNRVANLFAEFKRLTDEEADDEKAAIVEQICQELTVHTQLEEELFYPAVREATKNEDQMDEAIVEHASAKQLIAELSGADPDDDLYDAKVTVLGEQINHHVEEEEGSMFPKARYSGLDTATLGAAMLARKAELQAGARGRAPLGRAQKVAVVAEDGDSSDEETDSQKPSRRPASKKKSVAKPRAAAKAKLKSR